MKKTILNEIDNMKYLFNYDRSKTINEQQETPVPTPPASGSTVGSGPIPAPAGVGVGGNSVMPNTSGNEGQATSLMPGNNTGAATKNNNGENTANTSQQTTPSQPGYPAGEVLTPGPLISTEEEPITAQASSASAITPGGSGDPYQYKYEDDGTTQKYFYAKKGQENWKQSTNPKSVEAIKKNIFKIR